METTIEETVAESHDEANDDMDCTDHHVEIKKEEVTTVVEKENVKAVEVVELSLENFLLTADKLKESPSSFDGMDTETEHELRILGCELIQTAGILLRLPQVAMATGQVLFHRFFYCKSFVRHTMDIAAMGCVCLASKIEESPKRLRDIIAVFNHLRQLRCEKEIQPLILDQNYITVKTQVIKAERRILKELGFCVHIKHPHKLIMMYLQVLNLEKNEEIMQKAWNYMNDALKTDAFVQYTPESIACACIYLTGRVLKVCLPRKPAWYLLFNVTERDVRDISKKIYRLYSMKKIDLESLEEKVSILKSIHNDERARMKSMSHSESSCSESIKTPPGLRRSPALNRKRSSPVSNESSSKRMKSESVENSASSRTVSCTEEGVAASNSSRSDISTGSESDSESGSASGSESGSGSESESGSGSESESGSSSDSSNSSSSEESPENFERASQNSARSKESHHVESPVKVKLEHNNTSRNHTPSEHNHRSPAVSNHSSHSLNGMMNKMSKRKYDGYMSSSSLKEYVRKVDIKHYSSNDRMPEHGRRSFNYWKKYYRHVHN